MEFLGLVRVFDFRCYSPCAWEGKWELKSEGETVRCAQRSPPNFQLCKLHTGTSTHLMPCLMHSKNHHEAMPLHDAEFDWYEHDALEELLSKIVVKVDGF